MKSHAAIFLIAICGLTVAFSRSANAAQVRLPKNLKIVSIKLNLHRVSNTTLGRIQRAEDLIQEPERSQLRAAREALEAMPAVRIECDAEALKQNVSAQGTFFLGQEGTLVFRPSRRKLCAALDIREILVSPSEKQSANSDLELDFHFDKNLHRRSHCHLSTVEGPAGIWKDETLTCILPHGEGHLTFEID